MADTAMTFDGPCPFLTCLETEPHTHAACPACDAVRYGNPFYCRTCNTVNNAERAAHGFTDPIPLASDAEGTDRG